jgi:hypothetical protein
MGVGDQAGRWTLRTRQVLDFLEFWASRNRNAASDLSGLLREYARKFPQMGSRDRKEWSMGVYQALRAQRVLKSEERVAWNLALFSGLRFMHGDQHPWVEYLQSPIQGASDSHEAMEGRMHVGFPHEALISPRIVPGVEDSAFQHISKETVGNPISWLVEQGQPGMAWMRIRRGYESAMDDQLRERGWQATLKFTLNHRCAMQAWAMPLGLALSELEGFKAGWFEMQDWSCQQLVECMPESATGRWLDACAGSGGKTLLLHDSHPEIQWFVTDTRDVILQELSRRFQRAGWRNYSRAVADWLSPEPAELGSFPSQFDGILLDAPCSGSGSWRNHPHLQLLGPPLSPQEYALKQVMMLRKLWSRVRDGGYMLYSTCSVYRCENEDLVQAFLAEKPDATLCQDRYLNASPQGGDTMYAALIQKI